MPTSHAPTRGRRAPLPITRPGIVVPVRIDPSGLTGPTRGVARGPGWRSSSLGWWVPADIDPRRAVQRIAEAATVLPAVSAVTGWAALHWQGATWSPGTRADGTLLPVVLAAGSGRIRPQDGFQVCAERLAPREIELVDGLPVTSAVRSVAFEMRYARSVRTAVAACAMAAYDDLASVAEVRDHLATLNGWTGIPQAREALEWCQENSWSPMEVATELVWLWDAELPPLLANQPVFDLDGRHIGTPDLLEPVTGTAVDYHGDVHLDVAGRTRDRDREHRLREAGLECLPVFRSDHADRSALAARMRQIHAARVAAPAVRPGWTIEQPRWWVDTSTVDRRRALTDGQRARLLRYRRTAAERTA